MIRAPKIICHMIVFAYVILTTGCAYDAIVDPQQTPSELKRLFRSEVILNALADEGTPLSRIFTWLSEEISKKPLSIRFIPTGCPSYERLNFTSYIRILSISRDDSPLLSDLRLLHELYHLATMPYSSRLTIDEWAKKMWQNEYEASFFSEVFVYSLIPGLTEQAKKELHISTFWGESEHLIFINPLGIKLPLILDDKFANGLARFRQSMLTSIFMQPEIGYSHSYWQIKNVIWTNFYSPFYKLIESWLEAPVDRFEYFNKLKRLMFNGTFLSERCFSFANRTNYFDSITRRFNSVLKRLADQDIPIQRALSDGKITPSPYVEIWRDLLRYGISGMVYSEMWPEISDSVAITWKTESPPVILGESYARVQDALNPEYRKAILDWASPVVSGLQDYGYFYPCNGSSEALKDSIGQIPRDSKLHLFFGEYEGPRNYAKAFGIVTSFHNRFSDWQQSLSQASSSGDWVYISQPSGIDGNLWSGFNALVTLAESKRLNIIVDLAYVGAVAREYRIDLRSSAIKVVTMSLSKPYGLYYSRIGWAFTRDSNPLLYGNQWFKNTLNIKIAVDILRRFGIYDLAKQYRDYQLTVIQFLNFTLGWNLAPSDVIVLANMPGKLREQSFSALARGAAGFETTRVCLTPMIDLLVKPEKQPTPNSKL